MIIPEGYAQVNMRFTGSSLPTGAEITFGVDLEGYAGTGTALATAIGGYWNTSGMRALLTSTAALTEVLVKYGPNATGPSYSASPSFQGTDSGAAVPPNTAILVTKLTEFGGRAGRGRFYLPSFDETEVDFAGNLSPAMIGAAQTAVDNFHDSLVNGGTPMVVLHNPGGPLTTPSIVTSVQVENKVATQRRRLRR